MSEMTCMLCRQHTVVEVYRRDDVPTMQNRLYRTESAARAAARGDLELVGCVACGFIGNAAFRSELVPYDESYENDQTVSTRFATHMSSMAARVARACPEGGTVVEVGCGQGVFLRQIEEHTGAASRLIGYDPAVREAGRIGTVELVQGMFDDRASAGADVVVSRHVIEHIPDPVRFLTEIRGAVSIGTQLFLETPCVEWIITGNVLQDLFYEHCSYFSAASLSAALEGSGFRVESVGHVFEGQYLWAHAVAVDAPTAAFAGDRGLPAGAERLAGAVDDWTRDWRARAAGTSAVVWGAGAKGVTFATTVDPDRELFRAVVDVNPRKQGCFLPITAHPVVSWEDAIVQGARTAIIMNPNYHEEITAMLADAGATVSVVDA